MSRPILTRGGRQLCWHSPRGQDQPVPAPACQQVPLYLRCWRVWSEGARDPEQLGVVVLPSGHRCLQVFAEADASVECLIHARQCRSPSVEKEDFSALVSLPAAEGDNEASDVGGVGRPSGEDVPRVMIPGPYLNCIFKEVKQVAWGRDTPKWA